MVLQQRDMTILIEHHQVMSCTEEVIIVLTIDIVVAWKGTIRTIIDNLSTTTTEITTEIETTTLIQIMVDVMREEMKIGTIIAITIPTKGKDILQIILTIRIIKTIGHLINIENVMIVM